MVSLDALWPLDLRRTSDSGQLSFGSSWWRVDLVPSSWDGTDGDRFRICN